MVSAGRAASAVATALLLALAACDSGEGTEDGEGRIRFCSSPLDCEPGEVCLFSRWDGHCIRPCETDEDCDVAGGEWCCTEAGGQAACMAQDQCG